MKLSTKEISSESIINILTDASVNYTIMSDRIVINGLNEYCCIKFKDFNKVLFKGYVHILYLSLTCRCYTSVEFFDSFNNILKIDKKRTKNK